MGYLRAARSPLLGLYDQRKRSLNRLTGLVAEIQFDKYENDYFARAGSRFSEQPDFSAAVEQPAMPAARNAGLWMLSLRKPSS